MLPRIEFEVDDRGLKRGLSIIGDRTKDLRRPLKIFQQYMRNETILHFQALRMGGSNRGVSWPYFKNPTRVRKTDGQAVPPWGGVPRLARARATRTEGVMVISSKPVVNGPSAGAGKGLKRASRARKMSLGVLPGRRRPSGAPLRYGDAVLQDTRRLMRSVTTSIDYELSTPVELTWGTRLKYAEAQNKYRPFLFFSDKDHAKLAELIAEHLTGE